MTFFNYSFSMRREALFEMEFSKRVDYEEIINFTYEMGVLLESGIPILRALTLERRQCKSRRMRFIIDHMNNQLVRGHSLTQALLEFSHEFGAIYINLINIGEISGNLPGVMKIISKYMRSRERIRKKVEVALVYPKVVIVTAMAASIFLLNYVLPKFMEMVEDKKKIPPLTSFLLGINRFFKERYLLAGVIIFIFWLLLIFLRKIVWIRNIMTILKMGIPIWGEVGKLNIEIGFLRNMELIILAGVPIIKGIEMQLGFEKNHIFMTELQDLIEDIKNGKEIREALEGSQFISRTSIAMIAVGEESGNLAELLGKAATHSEEILERKLEKLLHLLEPALILLLALLVGSVVAGIYLPMFDMMNNV